MNDLPLYIPIIFGLTTLLTVFIFYKASNNSIATLLILLGWLVLQAFVTLSGFYTYVRGTPPRFILLGLPALITIILFFIIPKGRKYIDSLNPATLTLLHTIRVAVELVLFWLYINKTIPQLMTFEGRNFDIISGLTAPLIFYFGFIQKKLSRSVMLIWNVICIGLLINIVVNAILSVPFTFQQFGFEQPNIAVLYFPFTWLPCCVVPLVLFAHLATIRHLLKRKADQNF
jgi:hypothetical protein